MSIKSNQKKRRAKIKQISKKYEELPPNIVKQIIEFELNKEPKNISFAKVREEIIEIDKTIENLEFRLQLWEDEHSYGVIFLKQRIKENLIELYKKRKELMFRAKSEISYRKYSKYWGCKR